MGLQGVHSSDNPSPLPPHFLKGEESSLDNFLKGGGSKL